MLHCLGPTKDLERFERQFKWHIEKALECVTAIETGEGKSKTLGFLIK